MTLKCLRMLGTRVTDKVSPAGHSRMSEVGSPIMCGDDRIFHDSLKSSSEKSWGIMVGPTAELGGSIGRAIRSEHERNS